MDETIIDTKALSVYLQVPESWVREYVRTRTSDPIPHLRLGKYVRFRWGSPELTAWLNRRLRGAKDLTGFCLRVAPKNRNHKSEEHLKGETEQ